MFTPDVHFQYVFFSLLPCLIVIGVAYLSKAYQKLHPTMKKNVARRCSIMQCIHKRGVTDGPRLLHQSPPIQFIKI